MAQIGTPNIIKGEEARKIGDWDNAILYFTQAIEADEANGNVELGKIVYGGRAQGYFNKEDFNRAITDCNKAIEFKADVFYLYTLRGSSYGRIGQIDKSIADFTHAIQLNPKYAGTYTSRGIAYSRKGDNDLAIADFGMTIQMDPSDNGAYILRGMEFKRKGNFDQAIIDYNSALKLDPNLFDAHIGLGIAYNKKRSYQQAIASFIRAIQLKPNDYFAHLFRGQAYAGLEKFDEAIQDFTFAIESSDSEPPYGSRGDAYVKKGDYSKAIEDYTRSASLNPKNLQIIYVRAWANLCANDGLAAFRDADRYIELQVPSDKNYRYAILAGYVGRRKAKLHREADTFLLDKLKTITSDDWPTSVLRYVHGDLPAQKLLQLATDDDKLTEAHTYIGEMLLFEGKKLDALSHFKWVKNRGNRLFVEFDLAVAELNRLAPEPASTHYNDRIRASIDIVGISNFVTFLKNTESYRRDLRRVEYGDERDTQMNEFLMKVSPLTNVHKITKPMMVVQGKNDPRVPYTEAEQIVAAIKKNNTPVWYLMANDEGHGFSKKNNVDYQFYSSIMFVKEFLLN